MNDHIGKPYTPEILYQTLLRWLPEPSAPVVAAPAAAPTAATTAVPEPAPEPTPFERIPGLNPQIGLRTVGGKPEQYRTLLDRFVEVGRRDLQALQQHADQSDWQPVARRAHALKGAAGLLGLTEVQDLAARIEAQILAAQGTAEILLPAIDELQARFDDFCRHWQGRP